MMDPLYWIESYGFRRLEAIVLLMAVVFLVLAVFFIVLVLISRLVKSFAERRKTSYRNLFQQVINELVTETETLSVEKTDAALRLHLRELTHSSLARDTFIAQLVAVKSSLAGASAERLATAYRMLGLDTVSAKRLQSARWWKKVRGIRELTAMGCVEYLPAVLPLINARNRVLQETALVAALQLDRDSPLRFLETFQGTLTPWMEMSIHRYLSSIHGRRLPLFKNWYHHNQPTVRLFCLRMTAHFRQQESLSGLVDLANTTSDPQARVQAVYALGELEAFEHSDLVASQLRNGLDESLLLAALRALGKIGEHRHVNAILPLLKNESYPVRTEAIRSLLTIGFDVNGLAQTDVEVQQACGGILKHIQEPLLAAS